MSEAHPLRRRLQNTIVELNAQIISDVLFKNDILSIEIYCNLADLNNTDIAFAEGNGTESEHDFLDNTTVTIIKFDEDQHWLSSEMLPTLEPITMSMELALKEVARQLLVMRYMDDPCHYATKAHSVEFTGEEDRRILSLTQKCGVSLTAIGS